MKAAVFSTQPYDREFLDAANANQHDLTYFHDHLNTQTAVLAKGFDTVCCFVNDELNASVLEKLKLFGIRLIALRSAGFNHVDLLAAQQLGLTVTRVPAYSPHAVAEHAVGLILALNRKIHRAFNRIRENDFSLHGLMGFDCYGKTVGVIGLGKIGEIFAQIMQGFGCKVIAYDPFCDNADNRFDLVDLDSLYHQADIISLHCPLTHDTHHLINHDAIAKMKPGVMLINTSRGATIDTKAVIDALKTQQIAYLGLDVYEEEGDLFFEDLSDKVITDDIFARLQTFPNVIITGHQAFFTREAVANIARTTMNNITAFEQQSGEIFIVDANNIS